MAITQYYRAIVVGAGPAGIAAVGNLLDRRLAPILWVDDHFDGGKLHRSYRNVPSNTKVSLFLDFVHASTSLHKAVASSGTKEAYSALKSLDQTKGCTLGYAADLCRQMIDGLRMVPNVHVKLGKVVSASVDENAIWSVVQHNVGKAVTNTTPLLVMCTGSHPNAPGLPKRYKNLAAIDLDVALNPAKLSEHIPNSKEIRKVAVIGASHSAILILRTLCNLGMTTHPNLRVVWFSRHSLRYAEDMGGWILRDNTGLKGEAAEWAKGNLEGDAFTHSGLGSILERVDTAFEEDQKYDQILPSCHYVIEATGFTRNNLPELVGVDGLGGKRKPFHGIHHDSTYGGIQSYEKKLPGLYGAGIAFPEKVVDPLGNTEMAVGLWKFMRYLKKAVPTWVTNTS